MVPALLFWSAAASAQGIGDFMSPGPLAEPHVHLSGITQCTECHEPGAGVTPDRCMACHDDIRKQVAAREGFHATKTDCVACHPDHRGGDFPLVSLDADLFDHGKETGFELAGDHRYLDCTDCHESGDWPGLDPVCATCHIDPHVQAARARPSIDDCESCHGQTDWEVDAIDAAVLDHTDPKQVDYALEGAHAEVACLECHIDAVFVPTAYDDCTDCHGHPHRSKALKGDCETCHSVRSWRKRPFDHALTAWPLEGLHVDVGCNDCHGASTVKRKRHETCGDCHSDVHTSQFDPRPCDTCHTIDVPEFLIEVYDHDATDFPLVGEHIGVECTECHGDNPGATYTPVEHADCVACHEDIHSGSFDPTSCVTCHTENGWGVEHFDHGRTDFPLEGEHVDVECSECHPDEQWSGIPHEQCSDCHTEHPHDASIDACADCHTPTSWLEVYFDHLEATGYDLEPRHGEVQCLECHQGVEIFAGLDDACLACHRDTKPFGHYAGECESCHRVADWVPADLGGADHEVTGFELKGAHSLLECDDCHTQVAFGGEDPACISCHADDDVHRSLLGSTCDDCHTEVAWFRTRFRHQQTGWPLRGAHRLAACVDCHAVAYAGTPQACSDCHLTEASLDIAAHRSAFLTQCETCHRPYTWAAAFGGGTR